MDKILEKALKIIIKTAHPDKIILFGSRARGVSNNESDYDILILKKNIKKCRKLAQQIYLNFNNIGAPIDIIVSDLQKFEEQKNDPYLIRVAGWLRISPAIIPASLFISCLSSLNALPKCGLTATGETPKSF